MIASVKTFDFRSKLVVFALAFLLAAFLIHDASVCLSMAFLMIYLFVQGFSKAGLSYFLIGTALALLRLLSGFNNLSIIVPDVFLFAVLRILMVVMAVHSMVRTSPGEITAVLVGWRLPQTIALPITFMLRFTPTIKSEFWAVFDAMRLRQIMTPTRPFRALEYLLIPIIVRSSKVADELSASAELRGIAYPGPHTSLRIIRFTGRDWILIALALLLTVLCFLLDKRVIA